MSSQPTARVAHRHTRTHVGMHTTSARTSVNHHISFASWPGVCADVCVAGMEGLVLDKRGVAGPRPLPPEYVWKEERTEEPASPGYVVKRETCHCAG